MHTDVFTSQRCSSSDASRLLLNSFICLYTNLPALEKEKKIRDLDRFRGNGPYGKIPTKKEAIRTLGFILPYNNKL